MLEVVGIKASYKGNGWKGKRKQVLKDICFTAEAGQCIGIVGANGTGKSTLLSILAGVQKADEGNIFYQGKDLLLKENRKELHRLTGYVPQENPLLEELSAWDNLRLWYLDKDILEKELSEGSLADFAPEQILKIPVRKLSGGWKKRVSIACALAQNPEILLMDEPTAALDMPCKQNIRSLLQKSRETGKIVIFSTHDETELRMCDKLYILRADKQGYSTLAEISPDIGGSELMKLQK